MMEATKYVRKVDQLGRILLPKELRERMGVYTGREFEVSKVGNDIHLNRHFPSCIFCDEIYNLSEFKGKKVCTKCLSDLK